MMLQKIYRLFLEWIGRRTFSQKTTPIEEKPAIPAEATPAPVSEKPMYRPSAAPLGKEEMHSHLKKYLFAHYDLRYNVLTDRVEYRSPTGPDGKKMYQPLSRRMMNTMVIEARLKGVNCWDKDLDRLLMSAFVRSYHPFHDYMESLPDWDGTDRLTPLARRVVEAPVWVDGFRRWLLGLTAQWMGVEMRCANTLTPVLISPKQGYAKSTFCHLLMPPELSAYYTDKFDVNARSNMELKLGKYGLINLDEMDRYSPAAMATLKNLVQLQHLVVKKSYASYFVPLERLASFIATSNQLELLNDPTGSRRFLCVEVTHQIDCSPIDHRQIFAQLKQLVLSGERTWMDEQEERNLQEHNLLFCCPRPEREVFLGKYGIPHEGDATEVLTATEIHRQLCLENPSAMRGINVNQLGRTLCAMGLSRVHTEFGNKYRVKVVS